MSENQRLKELIVYLKREGFIYNQQDFVKKLKSQSSVVSEYINGKRTLGKKYARKICERFTIISEDWLLTGSGDMLKNDAFEYKKNEGVMIISDNPKNYSCQECQKKQIEINELKEKCELQRKLLVEYESKLPKNGQALFG